MPTPAKERAYQRRIDQLKRAEGTVTRLAWRIAAAVPRTPAERNDAEIAAILKQMPEVHDQLSEARSRFRGKATTSEENDLRLRATDTLRHWGSIEEKLRRAGSIPLEPLIRGENPFRPSDPYLAKIAAAYMQLEERLSGVQSDVAEAHGSHPYIAMHPLRTMELLVCARRLMVADGRANDMRYLEIGAGAGGKMMIAREYFPVVHGLEFDPDYVERGHAVLGEPTERLALFEGDAMTFENYGDYDVIYTYIPMREQDLQRQLEVRIAEQMRPRSVLLAPRANYCTLISSLRTLSGDVYISGIDQDELEAWETLALRVGIDTPPPDVFASDIPTKLSQYAGMLQPAAYALEMAGFRWL